MAVLYILREVRASMVLRLGNLQVVNTFNDGEWRFRRNWLRRNDRALDRERRQRGFGKLTAPHQLGHAEKRKNYKIRVRCSRALQRHSRWLDARDQRPNACLCVLRA